MSLYNLILPITSTLTVLLVNSLVLLMLKMKEKTLVDRMVLLDCLGNISTIGVMFVTFPIRVWGNSYLCLLITFFRGFVTILNRLTNSCLHHHRGKSYLFLYCQDNPSDCGGLQSVDGLSCGVLLPSRREEHSGRSVQV